MKARGSRDNLVASEICWRVADASSCHARNNRRWSTADRQPHLRAAVRLRRCAARRGAPSPYRRTGLRRPDAYTPHRLLANPVELKSVSAPTPIRSTCSSLRYALPAADYAPTRFRRHNAAWSRRDTTRNWLASGPRFQCGYRQLAMGRPKPAAAAARDLRRACAETRSRSRWVGAHIRAWRSTAH